MAYNRELDRRDVVRPEMGDERGRESRRRVLLFKFKDGAIEC
jgi:hypothetical protein